MIYANKPSNLPLKAQQRYILCVVVYPNHSQQYMIHLPWFGYFVQPVFPPFLICVAFGRGKLPYTDFFCPLARSTAKDSAVIAWQFKILPLTTLMIVHLIKTKAMKISRRFLHASHSCHHGRHLGNLCVHGHCHVTTRKP